MTCAVLTACEHPPQAEEGQILHVSGDITDGSTVDIRTPSGPVTFTVTPPLDQLPRTPEEGHGYFDLAAPDDTSFIGLTWDISVDDAPGSILGAIGLGPAPAVTVSLRAGNGTVYPLATSTPEQSALGFPGRGLYVALPKAVIDPSELEITLSYGGVTQSVTVDGAKRVTDQAQPYYDGMRIDTGACRSPGPGPGFSEAHVICSLHGVAAAPYLPRLGWAGEGNEWLIVSVGGGRARDMSYRGAFYRASEATLKLRLGEQAPEFVTHSFALSSDGARVAVFKTRTGGTIPRLTGRLVFRLHHSEPGTRPRHLRAVFPLRFSLDP